ncbi:MAG: molybdopterin-dependent oxidoreductase [bacterium]|nr:molybdopterin-dependent oxidoreductase [bacterium]
MILERREFLKLLGGSVGTVSLGSCGRFLVPDRMVELALRGPGIERQLNTICGLCEGGCGITVRLVDDLPVGIKGNRRHPLNRGGLCPVGQAGLEVLYAPDRLQGPLRRQPDGSFQPTGWDEALSEIAARLGKLESSGDGHKVAFLNGDPGQLFQDLARRFTRALGSSNITHRSGDAALVYKLAQGIDQIPGFDLANSDLVLAVGLDLFEGGAAPLHTINAMVGSREPTNRASSIHIGSRLSPSATKAEERLAVAPGTHAAAVLGIAHVLVREGRYDGRFVDEHTFGFNDWTDDRGKRRLGFRRLLLEQYYPDRAAQLSSSDPRGIIRVARRLARAERPVVVCGGESVSGTNATSTALAAHSLNALLGAFDRPGGVVLPSPVPLAPLAPTEPINGDGGEERAGIFTPAADSTSLGIDPVEALVGSEDLEVLFVSGTNPVYDSPAGGELRKALERIPLVVAFSSFRDETAAAADVVLPASLSLETWRESITPEGVGFSVLGVSQPVTPPLFDSRHPGDALLELARRVGGRLATTLPWSNYEVYLKKRLEGLRTSGQGSVISGSFEESWVHFLEERGWRFLESGDREAFWQSLARKGGWWNPVLARGDWNRMFRTSTGRYEFFSLAFERHLDEIGRLAGESSPEQALRRGVEALGLEVEASADEACLPHFEPPRFAAAGSSSDALTLVPFRPMTGRGDMGVASPMLLEMYGYPVLSGWQTWVELAPETAHELHLEEGDRVTLQAETAAPEPPVEAVVKIEPGAVAGVAHVPSGLGRRGLGGLADDVGANPTEILAAVPDPVSGALATVSTRVRATLVKKRGRGGVRPLTGGHG